MTSRTRLISLCLVLGALMCGNSTAADKAPETYRVAFGTFAADYNVVSPKGNQDVKIVYIPDFSDNYAMGHAAAQTITSKLPEEILQQVQAVVVPGDKANMVGTLLYQSIANKRSEQDLGDTTLVILRSAEKGKVENSVKYDSITGGNKALNIRPDQGAKLRGKTVMLFDDVISTGGTLKAAKELTEKYGCQVVAVSCVATEGDQRQTFEGKPLYALTHLPVWVTKG